MHHILGNKVLEYDVDDRGVIIDEREYDAVAYNKHKDDPDYYGISFTYEQASSARTRTGIADYHKNLPIQSQMRGCTITSDGTIKYLNPTDWTKYEDGTDRDYTLNTMVEIPEFWALTVVVDNNIELRLYQHEVQGAEYFPKAYCSAYEAYNDNKVLKSINNGTVKPTVFINRSTSQQYARANGSDNWNIYTYKVHKAIALLYIVEYANMNGQLNVNDQLTAEGYKQGGLGVGATGGAVKINDMSTYSIFTCGCTDSLGNGSGQITQQFDNTDAEGTITSTVTRKANRYRGIENPFGHILKNTIDVMVRYNAETGVNDVYYTEDRTKFGSTLSNYELKCSTVTVNNWYKDLQYTPQFELFVAPGTATHNQSDNYFTDYTYTSNNIADRTVLIGGGSAHGGPAGLFALDSNAGVGHSCASVGHRLVYLP